MSKTRMPTEQAILALTGDYRDWSNFGRRPVTVFGRTWPTAEHAFQAAKFFGRDRAAVDRIFEADSPGDAKKIGGDRLLRIRPGWDTISQHVMTTIVLRKFEQHIDLRYRLGESGDVRIVEGNSHGDLIWGACWVPEIDMGGYTDLPEWAERAGHHLMGRNQLGLILMTVRQDLA